MKIKAGDRIADLDDLWSGQVRSITFIRQYRRVISDLPNGDKRIVKYHQVKYNNELGCFIHDRNTRNIK